MKEDIKIFKSLGVETRYLIIKELLTGEKCACSLPIIIQRTQSNTSMQLSKMLKENILKSRRKGKSIFYSIKNKKIIDIFKALEYKNTAPKLNSCKKAKI